MKPIIMRTLPVKDPAGFITKDSFALDSENPHEAATQAYELGALDAIAVMESGVPAQDAKTEFSKKIRKGGSIPDWETSPEFKAGQRLRVNGVLYKMEMEDGVLVGRPVKEGE